MLQRKQTLWTLLAVICAALTFKFSFYSGNKTVGANGHVFLSVKAVPVFGFGADSASAGSVLILVLTILIMAFALINIFNFKNRKRQALITIGLILLSLLNLFLYWHASGVPPFTEGSYNLGVLLTVAIPIFFILAAIGIRKDEKLVKSADRLR
ncbi:MAG TPA: DUF4293 domain-containing protein [Puia sp.]|jgi:hypothetical protein|nr:DUF4293 domain-containing protein [Puia sp.]